MNKRLAIITTHPIQYNAPWFALLHQRGKVDIKVFYTWPQAVEGFDDPDFGKNIQWDIPLLKGYPYSFVKNVSVHPSSKTWKGIDNPTLIDEVTQFEPNAILVFGWKFKSHFALMRHFKGKIPVWFRGDSTLLDYDIKGLKDIATRNNLTSHLSFLSSFKLYLKYRLRQTALRLVYRYVDKALYVGTNSRHYFMAHGLTNEQLVLAPHAIDNQRFTYSIEVDYEMEAIKWRKELGISENDTVVLFAGKLEHKKNPLLLLNTIRELNQSGNSTIKLIFSGSGPLEAELKTIAGRDNNIRFISFINQRRMPVAYRLATIFCLPSQGPEETWGLGVNEALASGRPVLVSDKVGCAADVVHASIGSIFSSGNASDLKAKLMELAKENITPHACQQHITSWSFEKICNVIEKEMT
ncbi:glycosyltransferase family 4 protein [Carboxylicivirga sediminis]|uniref:Glycosyltransferase family 4 protein n=1 Tax=Carboxylicivirga sediminis TaxID=2006564 RepID=A0A941F2R8_9BACT|nr:glycosyltransferase family 4 protein [Carboxylicivirga sediminis]MBR8535731.1 glycosyltransferase family 4 protein [Carboxylicivirga sediminis]